MSYPQLTAILWQALIIDELCHVWVNKPGNVNTGDNEGNQYTQRKLECPPLHIIVMIVLATKWLEIFSLFDDMKIMTKISLICFTLSACMLYCCMRKNLFWLHILLKNQHCYRPWTRDVHLVVSVHLSIPLGVCHIFSFLLENIQHTLSVIFGFWDHSSAQPAAAVDQLQGISTREKLIVLYHKNLE